LPIGLIPTGTLIHNIELQPGKGGQIMRAAGTYAKIIKKDVILKSI
jgi:large subunit ribosomal protein L2